MKDKIFSWVLLIVVIVAYAVIGFIISVPYNFLAMGDVSAKIATMWLAPILLVIFFIIFKLSKELSSSKRFGPKFAWVKMLPQLYLAYLCLPVVFTGLSVALNLLGMKQASELIFAARFHTLWVIPLMALLSFVVWLVLRNRRLLKPPASPNTKTIVN